MRAKDRIEKIVKFAKEKCDLAIQKDSAYAAELKYRWQHTLRVAQYGKILAGKESADIEIAKMGGNISHFVAPSVEERVLKKLGK